MIGPPVGPRVVANRDTMPQHVVAVNHFTPKYMIFFLRIHKLLADGSLWDPSQNLDNVKCFTNEANPLTAGNPETIGLNL
jgi:hypothetical protein